jgi:hypothetical protein
MGRAAIEQLLYLMDEAFDAEGHEHSLLANIRSVRDEDWTWTPREAGRSVFDIASHVGECKYVYENHAFGDGSMRWNSQGSIPAVGPGTPREDVIKWLREGQKRLRDSVSGLESDDQLLKMRRANWGQEYETRWLISVMIQHDLYHAGEINHLRAMRQGDDRWAWETEEE